MDNITISFNGKNEVYIEKIGYTANNDDTIKAITTLLHESGFKKYDESCTLNELQELFINADRRSLFLKLAKRINFFPELREKILLVLNDIAVHTPAELVSSVLSLELDISKPSEYTIPKCLCPLADVINQTTGNAVGRYEVLFALLFSNDTIYADPGGAYDFCVDGENIHVKDMDISSSYRLGRTGTWDSGAGVINCIINTCKNANLNSLGVNDVKNNIQLEKVVIDRYYGAACALVSSEQENLDDYYLSLKAAAIAFEEELNSVLTDCSTIGDVKGFLSSKNGRAKFSLKEDQCFYAISEGFPKGTIETGRYVSGICERVHRKIIDRDIHIEKMLKVIKLKIAKDFKYLSVNTGKLLKRSRDEQRKASEGKRFQLQWNNSQSLNELCELLSLKKTTLQSRKTAVRKKYGLDFKAFKRVKKQK